MTFHTEQQLETIAVVPYIHLILWVSAGYLFDQVMISLQKSILWMTSAVQLKVVVLFALGILALGFRCCMCGLCYTFWCSVIM